MKRAPPKLGQRKKTSPTKKKSPAKPKAEPQSDAVDDAPLPATGAYSIGNLSIWHKLFSNLKL